MFSQFCKSFHSLSIFSQFHKSFYIFQMIFPRRSQDLWLARKACNLYPLSRCGLIHLHFPLLPKSSMVASFHACEGGGDFLLRILDPELLMVNHELCIVNNGSEKTPQWQHNFMFVRKGIHIKAWAKELSFGCCRLILMLIGESLNQSYLKIVRRQCCPASIQWSWVSRASLGDFFPKLERGWVPVKEIRSARQRNQGQIGSRSNQLQPFLFWEGIPGFSCSMQGLEVCGGF